MSAYCHGPNSPYGCGHHAEHVEAARKGWLTRRGQTGAAAREDERWFKALFPDASLVHTHEQHKDTVMFRQGRRWYSLPLSVYKGMVKDGREAVKARDKAIAQAEKQARNERIANERAAVVIKRERLRKAIAEKEMVVKSGAALHREATANYRMLVNRFRKGGIRPTKDKMRVGRYQDRGELERLPSGIGRLNGKFTLDHAREFWADSGEASYDPDTAQSADINDFLNYMERMQQSEREWKSKHARDVAELADLRKQLKALPTLSEARKATR